MQHKDFLCSYNSKKGESEKLKKFLQAGSYAPTAHNNQPQRIYIIQSNKEIPKIKKAAKYTYEASCFLLITYGENLSWYKKGDKEGAVDAAIVATHMMFEAQELGLATLWLVAFDREIIIKEFNLSDNIIPICILLIGYVSDDARPSSYMHFEKKKPEEIVEYL